MASENNMKCESFVRNLLGGASHRCFNCGLLEETHNQKAVVIVSGQEEKNYRQQPEATPNPQPQPQEPPAENAVASSEQDHSEDEQPPEGELPAPGEGGRHNNMGRPSVFTPEQLDRLVAFGHYLGWALKPHRSNPAVQRFCDSTGITRSRLRGWIHGNKRKYQR